MKHRPFLYLGLALAFALVVLAVERPNRPRIDDAKDGYFLPGFDSKNISRIEVEQLLDGVDLKRDGNAWLVADRITPLKKELLQKEGRSEPEQRWHLADHTRVTSALGSFGGLGDGILVSDNVEKQPLYQLDRGGVLVKGFDAGGKEVLAVVVGKSGPDFTSTYIRRMNDDRVFLVHRPLMGTFSAIADDWRERKLWAMDPNDIASIEVAGPKGSWRMERNTDKVWTVTTPDQRTPDATRAQELAGKFSQVRAIEFADDVDEKVSGLASPFIVFSLAATGKPPLKLVIGSADDKGRRYARLEGTSNTVLLSKEFIDAIPQEAVP